MARILGLDLGSYSVKGALTEVTLRGAQTKGFAEVRRGEQNPIDALRAVLDQLFPPHAPRADQVVTSLPGQSLVTHAMTLPFTDTRQIEAALPFELESQLPLDLSEVVFDYQLATQRDQKSDLLVAVVRKEQLREFLESFRQLELDPRLITHPGSVYKSWSPPFQSVQPGEGGFAILDIGHERTTIALASAPGAIEFARTFPGGGKALTQAVAAEFSISLAEAEQWKETQGAVGPPVKGAGAERAARALLNGLQPVVRETRSCLKAFTARTRRTITQIYLCGGTARLSGLDQQLSQDLGIAVAPLLLPEDLASVIPAGSQSSAAQAYTLSVRRPTGSRGSFLNLRRGEFAFKGDFDYLREKVGLVAAYVAVLIALLIGSGVIRNSVLASREKDVDGLLCTVTQRVLGQCEKNYDKALNLLIGKESLGAKIPKLSAASLLAEVTQRIPADIPVTFDRIEVQLDRVVVRGDTESPKQVDKITAALKGFHCFKEVSQGKVEKSKDGQKVNFHLDVQVECPEVGQTPQG